MSHRRFPAHSAARRPERDGYFWPASPTLCLSSATISEIIGADGSCGHLREKAQAARSSPQRSARKALQHPHRKGLYRLDPPLHSFSRQTPSERNGRAEDQCLPHASCSGSKCRRFQRPHCQASSMCLPRHPAGVYLRLVRAHFPV